MARLDAEMGPNDVILDHLEDLYAPVLFAHKAHAEMARLSGGCEICHHFTPPDQEHPACKDCHPVEILHEDIAQPGLKGAYHRNCMSCHRDWDTDTACEICHERKTDGEEGVVAAHGHYEPVEMQELIIFQTNYEEGDQVPFHHKNHSALYERDCSECHEAQGCKRCHVQREELHPMGVPVETDLHETCFRCHKEENCAECHGRDPDDLFSHASTGWPLKGYHSRLSCRSCHGHSGAFITVDPKCENCHAGGFDAKRFNHDVTGVKLDEVHTAFDCGDCHEGGAGGRVECSNCHDDDRSYDGSKGFGG